MIKSKIEPLDKSLNNNVDILIIGGGMVGLSLAHQISRNFKDLSIFILDKGDISWTSWFRKKQWGFTCRHFYKPFSLKSKSMRGWR